jgi:hypothetical protein
MARLSCSAKTNILRFGAVHISARLHFVTALNPFYLYLPLTTQSIKPPHAPIEPLLRFIISFLQFTTPFLGMRLLSGSPAKAVLLAVLFLVPGLAAMAQNGIDQGPLGADGRPVSANELGQTRAITTAVPFLMICPDARSGGLAEAGVAISTGAASNYWNPAALAFNERQVGFNINYTPWLRALGIPDINHIYLPFYYNFGSKGGVLGASLTYFSLGNIQFTDQTGQNIGQFDPNEFAVSLAYSHMIVKTLSIGINLRYIRSNLAGSTSVGGQSSNPGNSFAGDVAMLWVKPFSISTKKSKLPIEFRLGFNISNIGSKMSYFATTRRDFIPTNLKIGYAFKIDIDDFNSLMFTNDFNKLMVPSDGGQSQVPLLQGIFGSFADAKGGGAEELKELNIQLGFEYWWNKLFALRAGYFYEDPQKGNRQFFTLGAGLRFRMFGVDFAYLFSPIQNHPLQNTLRFGINLDFAGKGKEEKGPLMRRRSNANDPAPSPAPSLPAQP